MPSNRTYFFFLLLLLPPLQENKQIGRFFHFQLFPSFLSFFLYSVNAAYPLHIPSLLPSSLCLSYSCSLNPVNPPCPWLFFSSPLFFAPSNPCDIFLFSLPFFGLFYSKEELNEWNQERKKKELIMIPVTPVRTRTQDDFHSTSHLIWPTRNRRLIGERRSLLGLCPSPSSLSTLFPVDFGRLWLALHSLLSLHRQKETRIWGPGTTNNDDNLHLISPLWLAGLAHWMEVN